MASTVTRSLFSLRASPSHSLSLSSFKRLLSSISSSSSITRPPSVPTYPCPTRPSLLVSYSVRVLMTSRFFHSTHISHSSSRSFSDVDKIDPDAILFEGCDYKHWLIVMDFGKDPKAFPPPEQMVETYVQTLAKVVGSVEEAKKKIYACSTTTYTGFQAEIDEETSQKLEGLPGVIFVLPDSYLDPANKEYGGDKYDNGIITPRPPPVQYGRVKRARQFDQRPRDPMPNQSGNHAYNQHESVSGEGRGYMPQRGFPERQNFPPNYVPNGDGGRRNPMSNRTDYSGEGRDHYQSGGSAYVPHQGNYNHGVPPYQGNYNHGYTHPNQMKSSPSDHGSYVPHGQINNHPRDHGYNHPQGQMTNFPGDHGGYTPQGHVQYPGDGRNYAPPPPVRGAGGQTGVGSFEQSGTRQYRQGPSGTYGQGASIGNGPEYTSQVENQRFSQAPDQQNNMSTEHSNFSHAAQTGMNQRRF